MTEQTTVAASPHPASPAAGKSVRAAVGVLVFVELVSGIAQGMTPALVPQLGKELGISAASLNWIAAIQLLSAAMCVPILSRLGDQYGHRRLLRISLTFVLLGSALFAFAPSFAAMLVGQALLGPIVAMMPLELAIVRNRVDPTRARGAVGFLFASVMVGGIAGFAIAGFAHSATGSVRTTLIIPVVLIAIALLIAFLFVPESTIRAAGSIDWAGAVTLSSGLIVLLWTLGGAGGRSLVATAAMLAAAALLLAVWVKIELRSDRPLVDVRTLIKPHLLRFYLATLVLGVALVGSQTIGLTFLATDPATAGYGLKLTPAQTAQLLTAAGVFGVLGAALMSRLSKAIGTARAVTLGIALEIAANLVFVVEHDSVALFLIITPAAAFGSSLAFSAMLALITERISASDVAMGAGMYNTLKAIGGSLGGALFAFVLSSLTLAGTNIPTEGAYMTSWVICAVCGAIGIVFVTLIGRKDQT